MGAVAGVVPSSTMQTSDKRWVIIGGNGDSVYSRLMSAVGHPEMGSENPKYASNTKRCAAEAEIYKVRQGLDYRQDTELIWTHRTLPREVWPHYRL